MLYEVITIFLFPVSFIVAWYYHYYGRKEKIEEESIDKEILDKWTEIYNILERNNFV